MKDKISGLGYYGIRYHHLSTVILVEVFLAKTLKFYGPAAGNTYTPSLPVCKTTDFLMSVLFALISNERPYKIRVVAQ